MICNFSCKGRPQAAIEIKASCEQWEVPMTMHGDHHITEAEDAGFDATMKIVGMIFVLFVIGGVVLWYS
jgi:hypothetical protein